jgi:hypothetical protein
LANTGVPAVGAALAGMAAVAFGATVAAATRRNEDDTATDEI